MKTDASSVAQYIEMAPKQKKEALSLLREVIKANLPDGFVEVMSYGMIAYVVDLSLYPPGYQSRKGEPLMFLAIAARKNHVALYHMGLYSDENLMGWFVEEYPENARKKPDLGKSRIRFRNMADIPYDLIAQLVRKMSPDEFVAIYERSKEKTHGNQRN